MAYTDFQNDLDRITNDFGINMDRLDLFPQITETLPPEWLKSVLAHASNLFLTKEKERSEFLVAPILLAGREITNKTFSILSGHSVNVDSEKGLTGECDFLLTKSPAVPSLQALIITILEAKNQDILAGFGQCAAQMLGARLFNKKHNNNIETIFGCVTTGETWQWLKLENNDLIFDTNRFYISNVDLILGVFVEIVRFYETYPSDSSNPKSKI